MIRVLHCSDAHHDWKTGGIARADEVADAFEQTVQRAVAEKVDAYIFTGDLCDPDDGPAALAALECVLRVAKRLAIVDIPSYWISGNHDVIEDGSGRTTLSPLRAFGGLVNLFEVSGLVTMRTLPRAGFGLLALPYPSMASAYDARAAIARARTAYGRRVIVATHLQLEGMHPGEESTEMGRGRDVFLPVEDLPEEWLVLAGHYHEGQTVVRAGRRVHIAGSLVRLTHGEEKNRPRYVIHEVG